MNKDEPEFKTFDDFMLWSQERVGYWKELHQLVSDRLQWEQTQNKITHETHARMFTETVLRKEAQLKRVIEAGDALSLTAGKYNKWIKACKAWIEVTKEMR